MLLNPCRTLDIGEPPLPDFNLSYNMRMVVKAMIEQTKEIKRKYNLRSVVSHGSRVNIYLPVKPPVITDAGLADMMLSFKAYFVQIISMEIQEQNLQRTEINTFEDDLRLLKNYLLSGMCFISRRITAQSDTMTPLCINTLQLLPTYQATSMFVLSHLKYFLGDVDRAFE
ncbi:uncharacterized protein LOC127735714 [Mytilus californianus]|uniref:uncharacterized protein LOC127735714 n=1 Tax=Mytilus californianus TaxID=6549 RepID=UPI00224819E9|nr:uncharacterized protein LOC127735714 [Mytilus californianus]